MAKRKLSIKSTVNDNSFSNLKSIDNANELVNVDSQWLTLERAVGRDVLALARERAGDNATLEQVQKQLQLMLS